MFNLSAFERFAFELFAFELSAYAFDVFAFELYAFILFESRFHASSSYVFVESILFLMHIDTHGHHSFLKCLRPTF